MKQFVMDKIHMKAFLFIDLWYHKATLRSFHKQDVANLIFFSPIENGLWQGSPSELLEFGVVSIP